MNLSGFESSFRARNQITVHLFVWKQRTQVKLVALHAKQERMGGRGIAFDDRRGWVVSATPQPLYPRERTTVPILEVWCAPWPFWTGVENLASNLVRTPYSPFRTYLLYRHSYSILNEGRHKNLHIENNGSLGPDLQLGFMKQQAGEGCIQ